MFNYADFYTTTIYCTYVHLKFKYYLGNFTTSEYAPLLRVEVFGANFQTVTLAFWPSHILPVRKVL